MGQKVHPRAVRLGYIREWDSKWFNLRQMPELLEEDRRIREYVRSKLRGAGVSRVVIERAGKYLRVNIFTARPGIVIGKKGADIENIRQDIESMTDRKTFVNVMEIKRAELDAQLVADGIAMQLEKQMGYRRVMKKAIERTMNAGAGGVKVMVAGRLGGAEIARTAWLKEGRVPLQTFRADIDFGFSEALINMGKIGVKVWIFKKEHFQKSREDLLEEARLIEKEQLESLAEKPAEPPPGEVPLKEETTEDLEVEEDIPEEELEQQIVEKGDDRKEKDA